MKRFSCSLANNKNRINYEVGGMAFFEALNIFLLFGLLCSYRTRTATIEIPLLLKYIQLQGLKIYQPSAGPQNMTSFIIRRKYPLALKPSLNKTTFCHRDPLRKGQYLIHSKVLIMLEEKDD